MCFFVLRVLFWMGRCFFFFLFPKSITHPVIYAKMVSSEVRKVVSIAKTSIFWVLGMVLSHMWALAAGISLLTNL